MFIDSVIVNLTAGKGGNGVVAWRREKYIPKGGPAGGNGGRGGSIILRADPQMLSLEAFRNRRLLRAENGGSGGTNQKQGHSGDDLILSVPCGTLVKDVETREVLFDFTEKGQELPICRGGRGGKGNVCFKSPTNQAPNICTEGTLGETREVELELKLIADIGLIGMPNAGKSTLMSKITHVPVKIAAYPFTTLSPNLSYIQCEDYSRILVADIPGIIKDAHLDKGLGLSFLKHIERTSALVFVVDISGFEERNPFEDFMILQEELKMYDPELLKKPFLVALNKIDAEGAQEQALNFRSRSTFDPSLIFEISALEEQGIPPLINAMQKLALAK
jgi:GTPase